MLLSSSRPPVWAEPSSAASDQLCFHHLDFHLPVANEKLAFSLPIPSVAVSSKAFSKGKARENSRPISVGFPLFYLFFSFFLISPFFLKKKKTFQAYTPLLIPLILFPLSTALVLAAISTLPLPSPLPTSPTPKSLSIIASTLSTYANQVSYDHWASILPTAHLLAVLSIVAVWKHAWSIPGAILLNVLAGSIWNGIIATALMTVLTALGSLAATVISRSLSHWFEGVMPRALEITRNALDSNDQDGKQHSAPWVRLSLLRLVGVVPWSGINIASGIVRVPLLDCFIAALIGCLPWTVVTCQVGDILNNIGAAGDSERTVTEILTTWDVLLKLLLLTSFTLLPIFIKGAVQRILGSPATTDDDDDDDNDDDIDEKQDRKSRWRWSISTRSRSSSRHPRDEEKAGLMKMSSESVHS